jgi:hypothetical protein
MNFGLNIKTNELTDLQMLNEPENYYQMHEMPTWHCWFHSHIESPKYVYVQLLIGCCGGYMKSDVVYYFVVFLFLSLSLSFSSLCPFPFRDISASVLCMKAVSVPRRQAVTAYRRRGGKTSRSFSLKPLCRFLTLSPNDLDSEDKMIQRFCRNPTRAAQAIVTLLGELVWISVACKDQIVPVHEVPRHEDVWRSEDKASRIVNIVTRWRWVVSFTLHRLCRKRESTR